MFINKVVLFDYHIDIYFNASDDKKTHLKLKEMPEDGELFDNKKQPETTKSSDCSQLAAQVHLNSNLLQKTKLPTPKKGRLKPKLAKLEPEVETFTLSLAKPKTKKKKQILTPL